MNNWPSSVIEKVFGIIIALLVAVFAFISRKALGNEKRITACEGSAALVEQKQNTIETQLRDNHQEVMSRLNQMEQWMKDVLLK